MGKSRLEYNMYNDKDVIDQLIAELGTVYFDYDALVDKMVRERYSVSAEFAILRQRDIKSNEFAAYNVYVESCKAKAKEIWAKQDMVLSKIIKNSIK